MSRVFIALLCLLASRPYRPATSKLAAIRALPLAERCSLIDSMINYCWWHHDLKMCVWSYAEMAKNSGDLLDGKPMVNVYIDRGWKADNNWSRLFVEGELCPDFIVYSKTTVSGRSDLPNLLIHVEVSPTRSGDILFEVVFAGTKRAIGVGRLPLEGRAKYNGREWLITPCYEIRHKPLKEKEDVCVP